jgi:hypothetical protein
MSGIPLHLQRRFERRWAARFVSPPALAVPKSIALKGTVNRLPRPVSGGDAALAPPSLGLSEARDQAPPHGPPHDSIKAAGESGCRLAGVVRRIGARA